MLRCSGPQRDFSSINAEVVFFPRIGSSDAGVRSILSFWQAFINQGKHRMERVLLITRGKFWFGSLVHVWLQHFYRVHYWIFD